MPLCLATKTFKPHNPNDPFTLLVEALNKEIGITKYSWDEQGITVEPGQTYRLPSRELTVRERLYLEGFVADTCIQSS